jgi:hypothetical protein
MCLGDKFGVLTAGVTARLIRFAAVALKVTRLDKSERP